MVLARSCIRQEVEYYLSTRCHLIMAARCHPDRDIPLDYHQLSPDRLVPMVDLITTWPASPIDTLRLTVHSNLSTATVVVCHAGDVRTLSIFQL